MMKAIYWALLIPVGWVLPAAAQDFTTESAENLQVISGAGGIFSGPKGITMAYCIGEPMNLSMTNGETILTQGFEQPTEADLMNGGGITAGGKLGAEDAEEALHISLYPNPAVSQTTLHFELQAPSSITIRVIDQFGKVLNSFNQQYGIGSTDIPIGIGSLVPGGYYVAVEVNGAKYQRLLVVD